MSKFTCISSPTGLNACISSLKYHWFFVIAQPIGVKNVLLGDLRTGSGSTALDLRPALVLGSLILLIQQYNGLNSSLDQSNSRTSFSNRSKIEMSWLNLEKFQNLYFSA